LMEEESRYDKIERKNIANILSKLKDGKTLTETDRRALENHREKESDGKLQKPTQQQLADLYQCDQPTISRLKKKNINIYDAGEVRKAILAQSGRRPKAWISGCPWDDKAENDPRLDQKPLAPGDAENMLIELEARALDAKDYDEQRFQRTKIQSLRELMQFQILIRNFIHKDEIEADMYAMGVGVRAALSKATSDLPSMLHGLSAADMKKTLSTYLMQIASDISIKTSGLYKEDKPQ